MLITGQTVKISHPARYNRNATTTYHGTVTRIRHKYAEISVLCTRTNLIEIFLCDRITLEPHKSRAGIKFEITK